MSLCETCGSINIRRTRSGLLDKIVRTLTGKKRFTCIRCGWTARRAWHDTKQQDPEKSAMRVPRPKPREL